MFTNSKLQPIPNGEQIINEDKGSQGLVNDGRARENIQTNNDSQTNLRPTTNNHFDKDNCKLNLKHVVRYVKIQVPPKEPKPEQEKANTVVKHCLNPTRNRMKIKLKPPKNNDSEVMVITDENDFQEEIEIANVENLPMSLQNSSNKNLESNKYPNVDLGNKKSVMEQGTQTDIYGWLHKNNKLYSVVCDANMQCVTSVVPVLKTTRSNLLNFKHNVMRKNSHTSSRDNNFKKTVVKEILPATNVSFEEIVTSEDSLSDDDNIEDIENVEINSLAPLIDNKSSKQESITQTNGLLSENLNSNLIVPEKSFDLANENKLNSNTNKLTNPQAILTSLTNEVHNQTLCAIENNQNIFHNGSTLTMGSVNLVPTEMHHIPDKFVGGSHSGPDKERKPTRTHLSGFFSQLFQELKSCSVEDEIGNIPLHQAVIDDDIKKIKSQCIVLRYTGYNINHVNSRCETALTVAVKMMVHNESRRCCKAVQVLLKEGVDQTITDLQGYAPLHYAVKTGCAALTSLLLESNLSEKVVNKFGHDGLVPVHLAAIGNHPEIIEQLANKGCDINAQDRKSGRTPYFLALENKSLEAAKALTIHKAQTSTPNYAGQFPKIYGLKDNALKLHSVLHKNVNNKGKQVDDLENVLFTGSPTPNYSLDCQGKILKNDENLNCPKNINKHKRYIPNKTKSLSSDQSKSTQAIYNTANSGLSNKVGNKRSSKKIIVNSDTGQMDGKKMFLHRNRSISQNIINLENFPILSKDKNLDHFKIPQKVKINTFENNVGVNKSEKRTINDNFNTNENSNVKKSLSLSSFPIDNVDTLGSFLCSESNNEPEVKYFNDCGERPASCTVLAIDFGTGLKTLSNSKKDNERTVTDENDFSAKETGGSGLALDYGNVIGTLSNGKINNEFCIKDNKSVVASSHVSFVIDDGSVLEAPSDSRVNESEARDYNSSVEATSCTAFVLNHGNMSGSLSGSLFQDHAVIHCGSVDLLDADDGCYELSMRSPSQETICDIVPLDLQSIQPDVYKDTGLIQGSERKTNTTSKCSLTTKEGKNKRRGTEIKSKKGTKHSKNI